MQYYHQLARGRRLLAQRVQTGGFIRTRRVIHPRLRINSVQTALTSSGLENKAGQLHLPYPDGEARAEGAIWLTLQQSFNPLKSDSFY